MPSKEMRKKIGQLFMFGFEGRNITPYVKELVSKHRVGGVILFGRNISEPAQAWELIRSLKAPHLLVSVDHEGGRVVRLPEPVTRFAPAANLGILNSPELAYSVGLAQGKELAAIGFNLNYAPILDLSTNPLNRVIADRAFSDDPEVVAHLAPHYARGLSDAGVLACGKHFPGHGDTREDSHQLQPRVAASEGQLQSRELVPFAAAIKAGMKALMSAHVVYEGIDPGAPATLSRTLLTELLRKKMGFGGVIFTDDLEMKGLSDHYDVEDRTILALQAGADMLLYCHSPDVQMRALETVYRAVDGRIIKESRIEESYQRIQDLKKGLGKPLIAPDKSALYAVLNNPEHKALAASTS
jgi:beta-N-acetylhexosaminidase